MEQTACIIKPDAFPKYTGEIISRLLNEKFTIELAGTFRFDQLMVDSFYHAHIGQTYYENLSQFMISAPVLGMILARPQAIDTLRRSMGPANIGRREQGQIRFEFGDPDDTARNCIHGSDSHDAARYEIDLVKAFIGVT